MMKRFYEKKTVNLVWFLAITVFLTTGCASISKEPAADPFSGIVRFYQGPLGHLAMVRRGTTSMYPSSSDYSLQALKKHGPIIGWFMTCDRLVRSGRDELRRCLWIELNGRQFCYDPVSANDYWWSPDAVP